MSKTFTETYVDLIKLKENKGSKTCILLAPNTERALELTYFFAKHREETVEHFRLSTLGAVLSQDMKTTSPLTIKTTKNCLLVSNPDYIVVYDDRILPEGYEPFSTLLDIFLDVGKTTPVIIVSDVGMEISMYSDKFVVLDLLGKNETNLKIKASQEETYELYNINNYKALKTGVFYTNEDFFDNYMMKKIRGDQLFEDKKYTEAMSLYFDAYFYHKKNSYVCRDEPINQFLIIVLFTRILACIDFENSEHSKPLREKITRQGNSLLQSLMLSPYPKEHKQMFEAYDALFFKIEKNISDHVLCSLILHDFVF